MLRINRRFGLVCTTPLGVAPGAASLMVAASNAGRAAPAVCCAGFAPAETVTSTSTAALEIAAVRPGRVRIDVMMGTVANPCYPFVMPSRFFQFVAAASTTTVLHAVGAGGERHHRAGAIVTAVNADAAARHRAPRP